MKLTKSEKKKEDYQKIKNYNVFIIRIILQYDHKINHYENSTVLL